MDEANKKMLRRVKKWALRQGLRFQTAEERAKEKKKAGEAVPQNLWDGPIGLLIREKEKGTAGGRGTPRERSPVPSNAAKGSKEPVRGIFQDHFEKIEKLEKDVNNLKKSKKQKTGSLRSFRVGFGSPGKASKEHETILKLRRKLTNCCHSNAYNSLAFAPNPGGR
jgi:hypothetical protein